MFLRQMMDQAPPVGQSEPRSSSWLYSPWLRGLFAQSLVVLVVVWTCYEIFSNTHANLARLNKSFGFDFLSQSAGFDVITSLIPYSSSSSYGTALWVGFWNTLLVAVLGIVFSTILGFVIGTMRLSKNWLVSAVATFYIETIRNIPLLLQIFIWYALVLKPLPGPKLAISLFNSVFISNRGVIMPMPVFGLGSGWALGFLMAGIAASACLIYWTRRRQEISGQRFPAWPVSIGLVILAPILGFLIEGWPLSFDYPRLAGFNFKGGMTLIPEFLALLAALSIYTASFIAEVVRAGIMAVTKGQSEAANALGLSHGLTLRLVVIPQAMRVIIPPLASQFLNLTKNSSLAVAIGYPDLVAMGGTVINQSGKAIEIVLIWMVIYLGLSLLTSGFMNWFNARMRLVER
jgi:general L-amino acid transport system permease protein